MIIRTTLFALAAVVNFSACTCKKQMPDASPDGATGNETSQVTAYVTTANTQYDFQRTSLNLKNGAPSQGQTIVLDPATRFQQMEGFGAAITGSTCYNLMMMPQTERTHFLTNVFSHETGMGYSYIRISIGCSDFSLSEFTCCDEPGIENFALQAEDLDYVIPILKEILAINPEVKILGSPWTPPRWMKVNNLTDRKPYYSWTSGQLNPAYYDDYAAYFVKWVKAFEGHGIKITSVTPQNEPLNRGNSVSLFMGWDEQRDFVKVLGPKLAEAGLDTKIYVFDHNYSYDNMAEQADYPVKIYQDAEASKYVAGAGYHNYGGIKDELDDIHAKAPDKELIFTETSIGTWNDGQNLSKRLMDDMAEVALGTVNRWCRAVIVWNLMLDSNRGPNRPGGCRTCYGAVDISTTDYKTITRNSHYYIIGHLSSVVKPGATRIGTSGDEAAGLVCAAFENADGTYALVMQNNTPENKRISIADGQRHFGYEVPAYSVVSYRWGK